MQQKKIISTLLSLLFFAFTFASCRSEFQSPQNPAVTPVYITPTQTPTHTSLASITPTEFNQFNIPIYHYKIIHTYPHNRAAFTEGLVFHDGYLIESIGLYGKSYLRKVEIQSGEPILETKLPDQYFGEGLTLIGDRLIQLTWKEQSGLVYSLDDLKLIETFSYPTEGWGLTFDSNYLIMSDGTATLHFLNPQSYIEEYQVQVYEDTPETPLTMINELEFTQGKIFANIWQADRIAIIEPKTGQVTGWIDLTGLLNPEERNGVDVLNGIAYDSGENRLFVTGKFWPKLFEIQLTP